jgi:hypothetical protein
MGLCRLIVFGEADPPVDGVVHEMVSFLLALRRAFR